MWRRIAAGDGKHCAHRRSSHAGFDEADSLIDYPAKAHPAYRLLTEYFAFPEKFNFVDFDLGAMTRATGPLPTSLTLHIVLKEMRSDSHVARLMESLSATHFRLFCTPVVNLFKQHGEPIRVSHQSISYPVIAEARRAFAYEVYSIDSVQLVKQTAREETVIEFRPFYSLHHGEAATCGALLVCATRRMGRAKESWLRNRNLDRRYRFRTGRAADRYAQPRSDLYQSRSSCRTRSRPGRGRSVSGRRLVDRQHFDAAPSDAERAFRAWPLVALAADFAPRVESCFACE